MASLSVVAIVVNVIGVIWFREHAKASHRHGTTSFSIRDDIRTSTCSR